MRLMQRQDTSTNDLWTYSQHVHTTDMLGRVALKMVLFFTAPMRYQQYTVRLFCRTVSPFHSQHR